MKIPSPPDLYEHQLAHSLLATIIASIVLTNALVGLCGIVPTRFKGPWRRPA